MALHAVRKGDPHGAPPLVLLHGFGGCAEAWLDIIERLPLDRASIAYDLPGHGRSLHGEGIGHAGAMARAVLADLANQGIERFHLAGHSMGGAVAVLMALKATDKVVSLTLLSPGGFGPDINHRALQRYGAATTAAALQQALEPMLGVNAAFPPRALDALLEARALPGAADTLADILRQILVDREGGTFQGVLPLGELRGLGLPIAMLWGAQDMILPVAQAYVLEGRADIREVDDAGHMLIEEAPEAVLGMLLSQLRRA